MSAASNIDKFHFIKDSKLPALYPRRQEEILANKEIQRIIEEEMRDENEGQMSSIKGKGKEEDEVEMIRT
jgi:hypothetical protein